MFNVELTWISHENGGRLNLPHTGIYYCTTILSNNSENTMWSVKIIIDDNNTKGELSFLFDYSPNIIIKNQILDLYEGPRIVGYAKII